MSLNHASTKSMQTMRPRTLGAATIAMFLATAMAPTVTLAQVNQEDTYSGGKSRVNNSGKLGAFSESVAAKACQIAAGFNTDAAMADIAVIQSDFNTILAGLENGSSALGMPSPEKSSAVLRSIWSVEENWAPMNGVIGEMLNGDAGNSDVILGGRAALADSSFVMASDISSQYSDPQELLQADAITFKFIGRQRQLANLMSRTTCELAQGNNGSSRQELEDTVALFDASLNALIQGFPDAGIKPPPTDAVANSLGVISTLWNENRGIFDSTIAGDTPSEADVVQADQLATDLGVVINNTVTLYLIASPGQSGVYRVPLEAYAREELATWLTDPDLLTALRDQNVAHAGLTEPEIIALDQKWRAEASGDRGPLISRLMSHPVSEWLMAKQTDTAGFVTEVFVMDNKGLNVAQSGVTSDYWQGDEAKWKQSFGEGPGALHIGDVEFDDSTGFYQAQASLAITDPDTGEAIGAVTFGVNVQSLM